MLVKELLSKLNRETEQSIRNIYWEIEVNDFQMGFQNGTLTDYDMQNLDLGRTIQHAINQHVLNVEFENHMQDFRFEFLDEDFQDMLISANEFTS